MKGVFLGGLLGATGVLVAVMEAVASGPAQEAIRVTIEDGDGPAAMLGAIGAVLAGVAALVGIFWRSRGRKP